MRSEEDTFTAQARAEFEAGREIGPMRGSEVSRHGAIAGLCAAAAQQRDDKRRFYLAQQASYTGFLNHAPYGSPVTFQARVLELDKRHATSRIVATAGGETVAELRVRYTILSEAAFGRLFLGWRRDTPKGQSMQALPRGAIQRQGKVIRRCIERVPVESCSGHFDSYPALPVALLIDQLAGLGGEYMDSPYLGVSAKVHANDLCWADEQVIFEQLEESQQRGIYTFQGRVYANQREVCQAVMQLKRHA